MCKPTHPSTLQLCVDVVCVDCFFELRQRIIVSVDVGLDMLVVVDLHDLLADDRLQRIVAVWERWQRERLGGHGKTH